MKRPEYISTRHSVSLLYARLVFVTKYRGRVLDNAMLTTCETVVREVCAGFGVEVIEFNGEPDHVHLLIRYRPQVTLSDFVRRLKGASARRLRQDYTGHRNRARMYGHFWTSPYFAMSAGGAPLAVLRQYIESQDRPA